MAPAAEDVRRPDKKEAESDEWQCAKQEENESFHNALATPNENKMSDGGREYGVLGNRRMDCIGRMVTRPTERERRSQRASLGVEVWKSCQIWTNSGPAFALRLFRRVGSRVDAPDAPLSHLRLVD